MTTNTNILAMKLRVFGVTRGKELAEYTKSPAVIYYLVTDGYWGDDQPRVELRHLGPNGKEIVWTYRQEDESSADPRRGPNLLTGSRQEMVGDAITDARLFLGIGDWRKSPFGNCWLPVEALNRMRENLGVELLEEDLYSGNSGSNVLLVSDTDSPEAPMFHFSDAVRVQLVTEIREAAPKDSLAGINSLIAWFANGQQGDAPKVKRVSGKALEALTDDLEWIYQPPVERGLPSQYARAYVKNRRRVARDKARKEQAEGNGPKVLRDLLKF